MPITFRNDLPEQRSLSAAPCNIERVNPLYFSLSQSVILGKQDQRTCLIVLYIHFVVFHIAFIALTPPYITLGFAAFVQ